MKIEYKTSEYQFDHGKKPSGHGYWGFEFKGNEFWAVGTLTEAKKACNAYVKKVVPSDYVGTVFVNVMP